MSVCSTNAVKENLDLFLPWKKIETIWISVEVIMNPISLVVNESKKFVVELYFFRDLFISEVFDIIIDSLSNIFCYISIRGKNTIYHKNVYQS